MAPGVALVGQQASAQETPIGLGASTMYEFVILGHKDFLDVARPVHETDGDVQRAVLEDVAIFFRVLHHFGEPVPAQKWKGPDRRIPARSGRKIVSAAPLRGRSADLRLRHDTGRSTRFAHLSTSPSPHIATTRRGFPQMPFAYEDRQ